MSFDNYKFELPAYNDISSEINKMKSNVPSMFIPEQYGKNEFEIYPGRSTDGSNLPVWLLVVAIVAGLMILVGFVICLVMLCRRCCASRGGRVIALAATGNVYPPADTMTTGLLAPTPTAPWVHSA